MYSKSLAALSGDSAVPLAQTLRSQLNILQNRVRICRVEVEEEEGGGAGIYVLE